MAPAAARALSGSTTASSLSAAPSAPAQPHARSLARRECISERVPIAAAARPARILNAARRAIRGRAAQRRRRRVDTVQPAQQLLVRPFLGVVRIVNRSTRAVDGLEILTQQRRRRRHRGHRGVVAVVALRRRRLRRKPIRPPFLARGGHLLQAAHLAAHGARRGRVVHRLTLEQHPVEQQGGARGQPAPTPTRVQRSAAWCTAIAAVDEELERLRIDHRVGAAAPSSSRPSSSCRPKRPPPPRRPC